MKGSGTPHSATLVIRIKFRAQALGTFPRNLSWKTLLFQSIPRQVAVWSGSPQMAYLYHAVMKEKLFFKTKRCVKIMSGFPGCLVCLDNSASH
ncbi:similar to novel protein (predicted), isoform CRA_b [Rattus norvegicus]|uniref:Similar to novel protein (Predicted), isoform CRA_b n=1 Tax=Rattus norvegicus TaxID=10116 RepID=A6KFV1_RAT|nr:similar to novel protein (predicted), isoform CRA_b [Rattus norvegicus]